MRTLRRIAPPCFTVLALMIIPQPLFGGTITFTGDSALIAALGGSIDTGESTIAVGQTVVIPFNATVTGVEGVSGEIVLSADANGGSIRLNNVVFTALGSTPDKLSFGLKVEQAFAYSGPNSLELLGTGNGFAHFTGMGPGNQPGSVVTTANMTFTPSMKPDSGGSSVGSIPFSYNQWAFEDDTFPFDQDFSPYSRGITGITKSTSNPVTLIFAYETSLDPFNTAMNAGASTTLRSATLDFSGSPAAIPEPTSLAMVGIGMAGVLVFARRRLAA